MKITVRTSRLIMALLATAFFAIGFNRVAAAIDPIQANTGSESMYLPDPPCANCAD